MRFKIHFKRAFVNSKLAVLFALKYVLDQIFREKHSIAITRFENVQDADLCFVMIFYHVCFRYDATVFWSNFFHAASKFGWREYFLHSGARGQIRRLFALRRIGRTDCMYEAIDQFQLNDFNSKHGYRKLPIKLISTLA